MGLLETIDARLADIQTRLEQLEQKPVAEPLTAEPHKQFLTVKEAAEILGMSKAWMDLVRSKGECSLKLEAFKLVLTD